MIADIDNIIEINLRIIAESQGFKNFRTRFIDLDGNKLRDSERLAKNMESKGLIDFDHIKGYKCELTEFGLQVFQNGGWLKYLSTQHETDRDQIIKREKVERLNTGKLTYEYKLSKWKVKTFWWIFGIAIFSGVYSFYDIISKVTSVEKSKENLVTKEQMESELSKLRTLILDQKSIDSLHNSKTLADSLNKK